jgi:hypothetical protein
MNPGTHQKAVIAALKNIMTEQGLNDPAKLMEFESSPSLKDMIVDDIVSVLSGKPKNLKTQYTGNNIKVGTIVSTYVNQENLKRYKAELKKAKEQVAKEKAKIQKAKSILKSGSVSKPNLSLVGLQALLNQTLADQIKKNMGTGGNPRILNYQTGRFAGSAVVERISQSREGMLTAFYSYMKYPYQTFEPGFAQGIPRTRDPKLLISKSIREIAGTIVGNRMRAVSI